MLAVPVNLMNGSPAAANVGMVVQKHIRVFGVLHAVDFQLEAVASFEHVPQWQKLDGVFIDLTGNNGLGGSVGMPGSIRF